MLERTLENQLRQAVPEDDPTSQLDATDADDLPF